MLQLKFRIFLLKSIKSYLSLDRRLLNSSVLNMNTIRSFQKDTSQDDVQAVNKDESYPPVYIMSRIGGLAQAIKNLSKEMCPGLSITEINVPATLLIDPSCFELKNAEIVVCEPIILSCNYQHMSKLKWAHCTWAGVEPLFTTMSEKPHFIITKHSHEDFSGQMAEYVMAHMLILEKNYRNMWTAENEKSWSKMKSCSDLSWNRPIKELTLGILGVGNMGQAIAKFFRSHGTKVVGLSRRERKPSEFGYFDNIEVSLAKVLSSSDYIVNTLPSTPETVGLLDENILQVCSDKVPVFINVGRGDIIHEKYLLKALKNKWLRHAVLDVFENEENLQLNPETSELWNSSQVTITPHCAAVSFPSNIAKDFLTSFIGYQQNKPLNNVVDWEKGY